MNDYLWMLGNAIGTIASFILMTNTIDILIRLPLGLISILFLVLISADPDKVFESIKNKWIKND